MIELGPATEDQMVLAFLKAEIGSTRFHESVRHHLLATGFTREQLIEGADLSDSSQNLARRMILQTYRGFGADSYLFRGFPSDATWRHVELESKEIDLLVYANEPNWVRMSNGTRNPSEVVRNITLGDIPQGDADRIRAIQQEVSRGVRFPELIAAAGENGKLVLIEGHSRATAYVAGSLPESIRLYVASSPSMHRWIYF